jgi:hypothetical protein
VDSIKSEGERRKAEIEMQNLVLIGALHLRMKIEIMNDFSSE